MGISFLAYAQTGPAGHSSSSPTKSNAMETKTVLIVIVVVLCIFMLPVVIQLVKGPNPAVGTWSYTVETPVGPWPQTLTLKKDMSGTISVTEPAPGSWPIKEVKVDGKSLSYIVDSEVAGQPMTFEFKGNVEGDVITGVYVSDFGNSRVTGTRQ